MTGYGSIVEGRTHQNGPYYPRQYVPPGAEPSLDATLLAEDAAAALRTAVTEARALRALVDEILGKFQPVDPAEVHGRHSMVETAAMIEHWRMRAGLQP